MQLGPPNRGRSRAFTLIELMLVCLLIVILTALIIPEMKGSYQDALLRSTSRQLVEACDLAYSQAISLNQLNRVRLDLTAGRYVVEKRVRQGGQDQFMAQPELPGGTGRLDRRISIEIRNPLGDSSPTNDWVDAEGAAVNTSVDTEPAEAISFYPDGTADDRELLLRDRDGFGLMLRINPITARVKVLELERQ